MPRYTHSQLATFWLGDTTPLPTLVVPANRADADRLSGALGLLAEAQLNPTRQNDLPVYRDAVRTVEQEVGASLLLPLPNTDDDVNVRHMTQHLFEVLAVCHAREPHDGSPRDKAAHQRADVYSRLITISKKCSMHELYALFLPQTTDPASSPLCVRCKLEPREVLALGRAMLGLVRGDYLTAEAAADAALNGAPEVLYDRQAHLTAIVKTQESIALAMGETPHLIDRLKALGEGYHERDSDRDPTVPLQVQLTPESDRIAGRLFSMALFGVARTAGNLGHKNFSTDLRELSEMSHHGGFMASLQGITQNVRSGSPEWPAARGELLKEMGMAMLTGQRMAADIVPVINQHFFLTAEQREAVYDTSPAPAAPAAPRASKRPSRRRAILGRMASFGAAGVVAVGTPYALTTPTERQAAKDSASQMFGRLQQKAYEIASVGGVHPKVVEFLKPKPAEKPKSP